MFVRYLTLALALTANASLASAAPKTKTHDRVVTLVTESAKHYEAGRFEEAIKLLEQAYELEPDPTILYNLARAQEARGDLAGALRAYQRYIAEDEDAEDRGAVEKRIVALQSQIEERETLERERDLAARHAAEARDEAERAKKARRDEPDSAAPEASVVPWVVAGIGAAVIGGGVYFGLRARSRHEDAEDAELARDAANLNDEAKSFALLANVSYIAGGALVVGGLSWGIVEQVSISNAPNSAGARSPVLWVSGRF